MSASWDWPGSRWWRVDLHCHSPASHDFRSDQASSSPDWIGWVEAARDAGLHAVAVTDHNTAAGIEHLQRMATQVENAPVLIPRRRADDRGPLPLVAAYGPGARRKTYRRSALQVGGSRRRPGQTGQWFTPQRPADLGAVRTITR